MNEIDKVKKSDKQSYLLMSIVFDLVGYLSFVIPAFGEFTDIIWAPLSAYLIMKMYKGTSGKVAGFIELIEEGLPWFDFIPTFTLMWIYKYKIKKEN